MKFGTSIPSKLIHITLVISVISSTLVTTASDMQRTRWNGKDWWWHSGFPGDSSFEENWISEDGEHSISIKHERVALIASYYSDISIYLKS